MSVGTRLFAQGMEPVPKKTFTRIIELHNSDAGVRTLGCAGLFRIMVFSQFTWRESLRDIEVCLNANHARRFQVGIAKPQARSTLADRVVLPMDQAVPAHQAIPCQQRGRSEESERYAFATYVLIAAVRKEANFDASLYNCLQILLASIFETSGIPCAFQPYLHRTDQPYS